MTRIVLLSAAALCVLLAGCGEIRDFRGLDRFSRASVPRQPAAAATAPLTAELHLAERACTDAGLAAGFEVSGIAGSAEVADATGVPVSRDVMLRARRGGQGFEIRCVYSYATSSARIMTL